MEIAIIKEHLAKIDNRAIFDTWVSSNTVSLTNYFYSLSKDDLLAIEFDQFYFGSFTNSAVFKEFETAKNYSDPFSTFLQLLAATGERLAQCGVTATIDHIQKYLKPSSLTFRLKCISKIKNIDDVKRDYLESFKKILDWLLEAENFEEENYTQRIVDVLVFYFKTAEQSLHARGYLEELSDLKSLFTSPNHIKKYHFLGHSTIQDIVNGSYPESLEIGSSPSSIIYPGPDIANLFTHGVNNVVFSHPATRGMEILLGYRKSTVRGDILDYGKTDFTKPYDNLSVDDKVLLYCYFFMKKHFFTSKSVYEKTWSKMSKMLSMKSYPAVFIDLGCGPLTSGLALADLYLSKEGNPLKINYFGIDIAPAMLSKAAEFAQLDLFDKTSSFTFDTSWNNFSMADFAGKAGENTHFFINASYLFASSSLDIINLAKFVSNLGKHYKYVFFIFQNPDRADRNVKWAEFKKLIAYKEIFKDVERVAYKTNPSSASEPGSEDVSFEILEIKSKS